MTKWVIVQRDGGIGRYGPPLHIEYPQIVLKSKQIPQKEIFEPALRLLADPRFATANKEFVDGLVHLRKGEFDDAITSCGAAFESVLKTICTIKKWKSVRQTICFHRSTARFWRAEAQFVTKLATLTERGRSRNTQQQKNWPTTWSTHAARTSCFSWPRRSCRIRHMGGGMYNFGNGSIYN